MTFPSLASSPVPASPSSSFACDEKLSCSIEEFSVRSSDVDGERCLPTAVIATRHWRNYTPMRLLTRSFSYQHLPSLGSDSPDGSPRFPWQNAASRWRLGARWSLTRLMTIAITSFVILAMFTGHRYRPHRDHHHEEPEDEPGYDWMHFKRLNGYYNGVRTLVRPSEYESENRWNLADSPPAVPLKGSQLPLEPPLNPIVYSPYPNYTSSEYTSEHHPVQECFIDADDQVAIPDVYAYPGLPQHMSLPFYGSYKTLGLEENVCFERYGRLGPYGYGYDESHHGLGPGLASEKAGSEKIFDMAGHTDYRNVNWGQSQQRCYEKNKPRFEESPSGGKKKVARQAYVLRTWTGYKYTAHQIFTLRAMINELSLKSGGEYDVHLLLHVKDDSIPIWADKKVYQDTLESNVPREFWNITTLWSESLMMTYYPDPFPDNFVNMAGSSIHSVYRSAHMAIQWFSQQRPEYDFYWNWEMDLRYSGHYYEFHSKVGEWARQQPRKGLWERNSRFYLPQVHGDWKNFTEFVEKETTERDIPENDVERSGQMPVWGPLEFKNTGMLPHPEGTEPPRTYTEDNYEWGVGEEADLVVFNPIFDTTRTNWVFREDVTGYNRTLPIPPRRAAIVTVSRLSKRLLNTMHEETWRMRHSMFPEMWAPSVALHHGLKAVYAPHPVYFDRDWDPQYMNLRLNYPEAPHASPFGWGEHNMLGGSFYYNSAFSGALWRRWLGQWENGEGGRKQEEEGTGRLCLRSTLHHPIKYEDGPDDEPENA
ncbi:Hypothetical protein R9X50_00370100 [Acrodontium crateriforme]|uniref:Major facilitator superfamily transporter n=1 Tax=Acrodontium crateriforme TaxID=150365 RepID=A0AAQ3RA35_9PEZI|nr:Hypothetical protein R9X50_00370100 [Acrodontium crateriforme]